MTWTRLGFHWSLTTNAMAYDVDSIYCPDLIGRDRQEASVKVLSPGPAFDADSGEVAVEPFSAAPCEVHVTVLDALPADLVLAAFDQAAALLTSDPF